MALHARSRQFLIELNSCWNTSTGRVLLGESSIPRILKLLRYIFQQNTPDEADGPGDVLPFIVCRRLSIGSYHT